MARARAGLAFCFCLFGIAAQTLLFRTVFEAFDGRDVCIGLFMAGTFLWIGIGAFLAGRSRWSHRLDKIRELLLIACIPTFIVQFGLVRLLQNLTDAEPNIVSTSFFFLILPVLIATPLGLLMGLLQVVLTRSAKLPTGYVYGFEATGGFVGGLGITLLLDHGVEVSSIFFIISVSICVSAMWSSLAKSNDKPRWINRVLAALCLIVVLVSAGLRVDTRLTEILREYTWNRAVANGQFEGQFRTPEATYLYGTDEDQWVVIRGIDTYETLSDSPEAGRVVAMALAQNFMAERVLVIGDGLAICRSFLKSPNVKSVDWVTTDPSYGPTLLNRLPESLKISDARFHGLTGDIRTILAGKTETYDIVVFNLPTPFNATYHRFATVEFFEKLKGAMGDLGLVLLSVVNDGEPITSESPAYQAAWIKSTLNAVFARTIVVPQDDRTFVLAADTSYLEISPVTLETRFSLLQNAGEIFPPESLSSVYRPDRMLAALEAYDKVDLPEQDLVNTDNRPSHQAAGLQPFIRPWRLSLARPAHLIARGGLTIVILPIALLTLLRLVYGVRTAPRVKHGVDPADCSVIESGIRLTTGLSAFVGIGVFTLLLYAYQIRFGSLFSNMGLLLALFMLGLALGTFVAQWLIACRPRADSSQLFPILCAKAMLFGLYAGCLIGAGFWIECPWPRSIFFSWFWAAGIFCGSILVLGVSTLRGCHRENQQHPDGIEETNAFGATIGVTVTMLLLIPLLGFGEALQVIAAIVLAGAVLVVGIYYRTLHPGRNVIPHRILTPLGYALFGLAACIVIGSHLLAQREQSQAKSLDTLAIESWSQGCRVTAKTVTLDETSKEATYHEVQEDSQLKGYIFRSEDFTGTVYGFGGPMSIITFTDPNGKLIDFRISRSRETPRYIRRIRDWMDSLKGRLVFGTEPVAGVNGISGATLSCDAILKLLRGSGPQFAATVLAQGEAIKATGQENWIHKIDWSVVCWLMSVPLAIGAIYHSKLWSRILVLIYTAGAGGFWLNRQFSTDQVIRLLKGDELPAGSLGSLCLLLGVPLLIVLFGNLYCGYLCPFGALQELLGLIVPKRFKPKLSLSAISVGRFVKYALLFILVVAFFINGSKRFIDVDPLTSFFNRQFWIEGPGTNLALITAIFVLTGSLLVTRLWCRYLCPTGAFLSLLNLGGWLGRLLPAKKFGRCEFGLSGRDHLDCIYCDRCRYETPLIPTRGDVTTKNPPNATSWLFLIAIIGIAVFISTPILHKAPISATPETITIESSQDNTIQRPSTESYPTGPGRRRGR